MSKELWMTCLDDPKWAAQEIERLRAMFVAAQTEAVPSVGPDTDIQHLEQLAERKYAEGDNDTSVILTMAVSMIHKHEKIVKLKRKLAAATTKIAELSHVNALHKQLQDTVKRYLDTPGGLTVSQSAKIEEKLRLLVAKTRDGEPA